MSLTLSPYNLLCPPPLTLAILCQFVHDSISLFSFLENLKINKISKQSTSKITLYSNWQGFIEDPHLNLTPNSADTVAFPSFFTFWYLILHRYTIIGRYKLNTCLLSLFTTLRSINWKPIRFLFLHCVKFRLTSSLIEKSLHRRLYKSRATSSPMMLRTNQRLTESSSTTQPRKCGSQKRGWEKIRK